MKPFTNLAGYNRCSVATLLGISHEKQQYTALQEHLYFTLCNVHFLVTLLKIHSFYLLLRSCKVSLIFMYLGGRILQTPLYVCSQHNTST